MKKILKKHYNNVQSIWGYKKKPVKEGIHRTSYTSAGELVREKMPEERSDPMTVSGIEVGDPVAMAHEPHIMIGTMSGLTGFKDMIVQEADSGMLHEYKYGALVKHNPDYIPPEEV